MKTYPEYKCAKCSIVKEIERELAFFPKEFENFLPAKTEDNCKFCREKTEHYKA